MAEYGRSWWIMMDYGTALGIVAKYGNLWINRRNGTPRAMSPRPAAPLNGDPVPPLAPAVGAAHVGAGTPF
eukprot:gene11420-biopygen8424